MRESDEFQPDDAKAIVRRVREELARRRMSRQALADMARISISTLEKVLSGTRSLTLATVLRLEEALGTPLRSSPSQPERQETPLTAPENLGAYTRPAVKWLEGQYLTLRPSFGSPGVYTYVTHIEWDAEKGHLTFAESKRIDEQYQQTGVVAMPHLSGHIYLVTNQDGQFRMMILGRPDIKGSLSGVLSTLQVGHGSQLVPTACPVVQLRLERHPDATFGTIAPDHAEHDHYRALLDGVTAQDFARFPL